MIKRSLELLHPDYMHIQQGLNTLYGCDQDWYKIEWRRRAGCGPVAATNILLYLKKKDGVNNIPYHCDNVEEALAAMNDAFLYVRPRIHGLNKVRGFVKGMALFGRQYNLSFRYRYIIIPPKRDLRPDLGDIINFIVDGLRNDIPVVFLNLHAGAVENQLSSWHWVTVVGIDIGSRLIDDCADTIKCNTTEITDSCTSCTSCTSYTNSLRVADAAGASSIVNSVLGPSTEGEAVETVTLRFYDQSKALEVDLIKWLNTTSRGGGFAYFYNPKSR